MQVNGRTLILAALGLSVAMAGGAWWFHYQGSRQAATFWGPQAAELLIGKAKISLLELQDDDQTAGGETIAGRAVIAEHDLSEKPGLIHFRHALTQDANFEWEQRRQVTLGSAEPWPYALRFADGEQRLIVLVGPGFERIGKVDAAAKHVDVLPCPRLGPAMMTYLRDVGVPVGGETAR